MTRGLAESGVRRGEGKREERVGVGGPPQRERTRRPPRTPHRFHTGIILLLLGVGITISWPLPTSANAQQAPGAARVTPPRTTVERSNYTATSRHADVLAFLDTLAMLGAPMARGTVGNTSEGRAIPYVVVSRPLLDTPEAAHRSGRPVVYVQGNIHGGEVEGKESLQALLRDLMLQDTPNVLDSIVLIAVPIYNADGNEKLDAQVRNRGSQNGPEMIGQRANAQGFDLNRDYMKGDAPETRGSLQMFNRWDPHVLVDLHTTNGSYHGYHLTYAPSLNPAAELPGLTFGGAYARDSLLPELQRRVRDRHRVNTFPYGNFAGSSGDVTAPPTAWATYDHRPRFGTNYYALRGRIAILSEAYSHDPFDVRVRATTAFVRELLSLVAERRRAVLALAHTADSALAAGALARSRTPVPLRARLTTHPAEGEVVYEQLERTADSVRHEPGVRPGLRRTGRFVTRRMPIVDRFEPVLSREAPYGYAIAPTDTAALALVRLHGLAHHRLTNAWSGDPGVQFVVDSQVVAPRPFQGRREARLDGRWVAGGTVRLSAGTIIVPVAQRLGVVAMYLLEPESDDGVVNWDVGERISTPSPATPPIVRLARPIDAAMEQVR